MGASEWAAGRRADPTVAGYDERPREHLRVRCPPPAERRDALRDKAQRLRCAIGRLWCLARCVICVCLCLFDYDPYGRPGYIALSAPFRRVFGIVLRYFAQFRTSFAPVSRVLSQVSRPVSRVSQRFRTVSHEDAHNVSRVSREFRTLSQAVLSHRRSKPSGSLTGPPSL